jgi:hypothetical protein
MCGQGDFEIVNDWRNNNDLEALKQKVIEKGYSAVTVSSGQPSFGHAALKSFDYQLNESHLKSSNNPCNIHIYTKNPVIQNKPKTIKNANNPVIQNKPKTIKNDNNPVIQNTPKTINNNQNHVVIKDAAAYDSDDEINNQSKLL